jgi:hypothetical protein
MRIPSISSKCPAEFLFPFRLHASQAFTASEIFLIEKDEKSMSRNLRSEKKKYFFRPHSRKVTISHSLLPILLHSIFSFFIFT